MPEEVDIEVGRLALRTFRLSTDADHRHPSPNIDTVMGGWILTGYRGRGVKEDSQMTSVAVSGLCWSDGTCKAQCASMLTMMGLQSDSHRTPSEGCHCGVYGTLSWHHLRSQYPNYADKIVTVIAAEGQAIMGTRGLRCQYARVIAYWCVDEYAPVCGRQFKDAKQFSTVEEMIGAHGIPEYTDAEKKAMEEQKAIMDSYGFGNVTLTIAPSGGSATLPALISGGSYYYTVTATTPPTITAISAVPAPAAPQEEEKEEKEGWAKANPSLEQKSQQREARKKALLKKLGLA